MQVGAVPASWQAPLHFSNPATGVALNVTSAKAGTLVAQLPFPEHERPASGLVTAPESPPSTTRASLVGVNVATTVRFASILTVHGPVPVHS